MRKISVIIVLMISLVSCKKEPSDFIWERSFGTGSAYFAEFSSDSGIVACGTINNKPYLLKLDKSNRTVTEYTSGNTGLFSSAWSDTSRYIAAGNSNGKMLLECIDKSGSGSWDTTLTAGFQVAVTNLFYAGNGNFLALGSALPDSSSHPSSALLFVRFDTTGNVKSKTEFTGTNYIAAGSLSVDNSGNIFLPLTRKAATGKSKASVAKFNSDFQRIWETELYNNPDFGATAKSILLDRNGQIYVTGKTEVSREGSLEDNSFVASLSGTGAVIWKDYKEFTNCGSALLLKNDELMVLNRNCFIVSMIDPDNGTDTGLLRMFSVCNSKNTDAFGYDLDINNEGNLLVSGMRGDNFYLALKKPAE